MVKKIILTLVPILFLSGVYYYVQNKPVDTINQTAETLDSVGANKNMNLSKPSMQIDISKNYSAILKTSQGNIEISLNAKETPITVNNFVYLAKSGLYGNTIFHRVIKGFMIQGGDPKGDGTGGPGYKFDDEKFSGEYTRGTVAMANSGPNTNGSQFFIMHADVPLQKDYVIFGKVVKGMDVVDKIASAPAVSNGFDAQPSKPVNPVSINSVEIIEN